MAPSSMIQESLFSDASHPSNVSPSNNTCQSSDTHPVMNIVIAMMIEKQVDFIKVFI
jgi:hypothetical protein